MTYQEVQTSEKKQKKQPLNTNLLMYDPLLNVVSEFKDLDLRLSYNRITSFPKNNPYLHSFRSSVAGYLGRLRD